MSSLPCVRCGNCCRQGGICDIRVWTIRPYNTSTNAKFNGTCDLLIEGDDGTTSCKGIVMAFDKNVEWHEKTRQFVTQRLVGCGCDCPEKRKEHSNVH